MPDINELQSASSNSFTDQKSKSNLLLWIFIGLSSVLLVTLIVTSSILITKNSNLQTALNTAILDTDKAKQDFDKANSELTSAQTDKKRLEDVITTVQKREDYLNQLTVSGQKISEVSVKIEDAIQNQDITLLQSLFPQLQKEVDNYNDILDKYTSFLSSNQVILEKEVKADVTATIKSVQDTKSILSQQISTIASIMSLMQSSAGP